MERHKCFRWLNDDEDKEQRQGQDDDEDVGGAMMLPHVGPVCVMVVVVVV